MPNKHSPFYPIIYVRGYAMTAGEIDQTTADPFCGFNLGSTVYRAVAEKDRQPRKFVFESPLIRLATDFGYRDVYENGYDILDPEWQADTDSPLSSRSVIIYRYYDEASRLLGIGKTPSLEAFSSQLGELIIKIRDLVCGNAANGIAAADFRCYLVAHSMGGLVCRGLLQNPKLDKRGAAKLVDKLFTYATPHNGIELLGVNTPSWLSLNDINNFSRDNLAKFLDLADAYKATGRVDWLPEKRFPSEQVFCMVGSNRLDYEAALGLSRTFVGHGSDGLVRIENATLRGLDAQGKECSQCAKAFTYRAHSGFFGIVNSEEAYQNLTRFLFGDVRVDLWLDIDDIALPDELRKAEANGETVNALYQIEVLASPRGKLWYLTRRTVEEDSVACLAHQDWKREPKKNSSLYLSTLILANRARVNPRRRSLAYSLALNIRVPDYEVERRLWINQHFEGSYLFRNALILELVPPPANDPDAWRFTFAWQNQGVSQAREQLDAKALKNGKVEVKVPFDSGTRPGIKGQLRFVVSTWNAD
ncbi:hypothetical protein NVV93_08060 [Pseudomonas sp. LS44]|uniref:esterase/lipase family protein n=1 Tax=Pseudomonas sp. LS44 TaxID=1357074 RepID=UPI00215ACDC4|nr:hypothetical protein [Pseudomonas sp. LS44]UVE19317.1 hypothetical protein NVV93_08060 [Pseudomonas sp. LS44]